MESEMKKLLRTLQIVYYSILVAVIAVAALMWYYASLSSPIEEFSTYDIVMQYVAIIFVIAGVPLSLYGFKVVLKKVKAIDDNKTKILQYQNISIVRMGIIAVSCMFALIVYFMLDGLQSMMWCAAIAAIALVFCKPTEGKIEADLSKDDDSSRF